MKKENEVPTPETKESGKAIRREKAGTAIFAILLALVLGFAMCYATTRQFEKERDAAYPSNQ